MASLSNPNWGSPTRFPYGAPYNPLAAPGVADVLPIADAVVFVTGGAPDLMTLALPKAGVYSTLPQDLGTPSDDGKRLLVYLTTAHIDTITTPAGGINGTLHIVTFTAVKGNFVELIAFNGTWWVAAQLGAVLS